MIIIVVVVIWQEKNTQNVNRRCPWGVKLQSFIFVVGSPLCFSPKLNCSSLWKQYMNGYWLFKNKSRILKATTYFTSWVPVNMCNITRSTFTDANSFACKHVVNIHKVVVGCHSKVFSCICKENVELTLKHFTQEFTSRSLFQSGEKVKEVFSLFL